MSDIENTYNLYKDDFIKNYEELKLKFDIIISNLDNHKNNISNLETLFDNKKKELVIEYNDLIKKYDDNITELEKNYEEKVNKIRENYKIKKNKEIEKYKIERYLQDNKLVVLSQIEYDYLLEESKNNKNLCKLL
uniref:Uncharacterized protein n=1 Tax=viral metagenome TaxID=1070528 RepID=A0A6C0E037_9ZZZZ